MKHAVNEEPDRITMCRGSLAPKKQLAGATINPTSDEHGDWKYDSVNKQIAYLGKYRVLEQSTM